LGEVHQSNQMLAICTSLIQLWATSDSLDRSWAISNSSTEILVHLECLGELQELYSNLDEIGIIWGILTISMKFERIGTTSFKFG